MTLEIQDTIQRIRDEYYSWDYYESDEVWEESDLNSNHFRNKDNTSKWDFNCGGWALETFDWFMPYDIPIADIADKLKSDFTIKEIVDAITEECRIYMQRLFNGRLKKVSADYMPKENEIFISFRLGKLDYDNLDDFDFHFRKFDPEWNCWTEKNGALEIKACNQETGDWIHNGMYHTIVYSGPIIYFCLEKD